MPERIAGVAIEASICRNIGAYRGALALARAVVEATAKDKGCTRSGILQKIEWLRDEACIRRSVFEGADESRISRNSIAHDDLTTDVTEAECDEVLLLMKDALNEEYESEARASFAPTGPLR